MIHLNVSSFILRNASKKKKTTTQSSPALCPLIDTSMLCELPSNDTSFPKEQQEILQSSCPYFFIFYFLPVKLV